MAQSTDHMAEITFWCTNAWSKYQIVSTLRLYFNLPWYATFLHNSDQWKNQKQSFSNCLICEIWQQCQIFVRSDVLVTNHQNSWWLQRMCVINALKVK